MGGTIYIVRLEEAEDERPKQFGRMEHARAHAHEEINKGRAAGATIYKATEGARPELVERISEHASDAEIERAFNIAWAKAIAENDDAAILKLLGL